MTSGETYTYNHCLGYGCHEQCTLKTVVKDGKVIRTERMELTGPEKDRFYSCQKGMLYARFPYHEKKLRYPMKRVGARGSTDFERISWDQAISEIGEKLRHVRDTYGPESVVLNSNPSGMPGMLDALIVPLSFRFVNAFGATFSELHALDVSFFGAHYADYGSTSTYNWSDPRMITKSKHVTIWGSNPLGNTKAGLTTHALLDAQENGAKLVSIGIMYNSTAAMVDQFIPIKPGTDAVMALACARRIIELDAVDRDYLENGTVAPFLVRTDNGKFLRAADLGGDGWLNPESYLAWSAENDALVEVPPHTHYLKGSDLEAVKTVNGIECKTAFVMLKEHVDEWTPEKQEEITGVPADVLLGYVDDYVSSKPALIYLEEAMRYQNSVQSYRGAQLLATLTGNVRLEGGGVTIQGLGGGQPVGLNKWGVMVPDGVSSINGNYVDPEDLIADAWTDNPKYRGFLLFYGNPAHSAPNRKNWERVFENMEISVVCDIVLSDTCRLADYALPDCCTLERDEISTAGTHVVYCQRAIEPQGEEKPAAEIISLIAKEVGLEKYFDKTVEEWFEFQLQTDDPKVATVEPKITMERLKKEPIIRVNADDKWYNPMDTEDWMTRSGRIEFYSDLFSEINLPMATYTPTLLDMRSDECKEKFPLQLIVGRARLFMQTQPYNLMSELVSMVGNEPWMWISHEDALERGIRNGDMVEVENDRSKMKLKAVLTKTLPKGIVEAWLHYRIDDYEEGCPTYMMTSTGTYETYDEFARLWREAAIDQYAVRPGQTKEEAAAEGRFPASMNFDTMVTGNYDVLWDNYCEVRLASKEGDR